MCAMREAIAGGLLLVGRLAMAGWALAGGFLPRVATAAETPGFATLERADSGSRVEAALGLSFYGDEGPDWVGRADLYGQFSGRSGWGGYATVPYAFVLDDTDFTGLGNLELGGLYTTSGNVPFVLRAGIVFDTQSDDFEASFANGLASGARLTDLSTAVTNVMWLRLSVSPTWRSGRLFTRFDAGLDLPFTENGSGDVDTLMHFNWGLGYDFGSSAATLEFVNIGTTGEPRGSDRFIHLLSLGVRGSRGDVRPFGALSVPIDDDLGELNAVLILGMQLHID